MSLHIKSMSTVSVVTPWLNHPELIEDYSEAVRGAEIVIVDNGSDAETAALLMEMLGAHGYPERHRYIRRQENGWFSGPVNEGIAAATGDVIVALNNDIRVPFPGFIAGIRNDVDGRPGIYGPSSSKRLVQGVAVPYIEGWCIAATRETWTALGGFDEQSYPRPYWEDVDLSFRAMTLGIPLYRTDWALDHLSNTTSGETPGAYDDSERNRVTFETRVRAFLDSTANNEEVADAVTAQADAA